MNIFYLDRDPAIAAKQHYNKHVVKMVLEAAQLLSTAHHIEGNSEDVPYKKTHVNHPSAIWVRSSIPNYLWCYNYMLELGKEYTRRYGRNHLTISKCQNILSKIPIGITNTNFTDPPQCMPDEYKNEDAVKGYLNYYIKGKSHLKDTP